MEITLWHGGRDLEKSYREHKESRPGKWEHGPGLYLTSNYGRAYKYAKGGGSTYLVTVAEGNNIKDVGISINSVKEFIETFVTKKSQKEVLQLLSEYKNNGLGSVRADQFLNVIINTNSIKSTNSIELLEFLVKSGVDYAMVKGYDGGSEDVLVVMNKSKIKNVEKVAAKDLDVSDYDMEFAFKDVEVSKKNQTKMRA